MRVWGVWEHGWEDDTLYGLYRTRKAAAEHRMAFPKYRRKHIDVESHDLLDAFEGVDGLHYAKQWQIQARWRKEAARR